MTRRLLLSRVHLERWQVQVQLGAGNRRALHIYIEDDMVLTAHELQRWADEERMVVSTEKTEFIVFTPRLSEAAAWSDDRPPCDLRFGGTPLRYNKTPRFLGVIFDESLSFRPHVKKVQQELQARNKILLKLACTNWGYSRNTLSMVHASYIQAKADYGLAAYGARWPATSRKRPT